MKHLSLYFLAIAAAAGLWSCGGNADPDTPAPVDNAPTSISLGSTSQSVPSSGGSYELSITAPQRPSFSSGVSWLTYVDGTYKDYKMTITVNVAANASYEQRTGTLTVTSGSLSATFSVTQEAAEKPKDPDPDPNPGPDTEVNIATTPVNADATANAKRLYKYLYDQYGKKMISSIMADVNWNNKEAEKVHDATGKYPAMNCYDFIHIYVPDGNGWIDYSDLTPVTSWAAAGGIVSLMWHFNVPRNKDTEIKSDGSGVTCSPSETSFRAKNVFTSGTWENEWFYSQMDKVVSVILALQDKGIAAIWRPFHEAAGNATYKQQAGWATSWFWWGYDGADTFKKLWITMYDYFKSKGVNNLIWVWTTQNYNGNSSAYNQDTDWYPGAEYVDIVARDLYGSTSAENATEFAEIQKAYPTKMVTLGECGSSVEYENGKVKSKTSFASMTDVWSAGAKWSWFMPWYGDNMPDTTWWGNALGNANVVSRAGLPSDLFE